nr:hypothetical protein 6 [Desulfobulbaceae bacterium]
MSKRNFSARGQVRSSAEPFQVEGTEDIIIKANSAVMVKMFQEVQDLNSDLEALMKDLRSRKAPDLPATGHQVEIQQEANRVGAVISMLARG